ALPTLRLIILVQAAATAKATLKMAEQRDQAKAIDRVAAIPYRREGGTIRYLVVSSSEFGWTFPKGKLDRSDEGSLVKAAKREAREEAGVSGKMKKQPLIDYRFPRAERDDQHLVAFLLKVEQ